MKRLSTSELDKVVIIYDITLTNFANNTAPNN